MKKGEKDELTGTKKTKNRNDRGLTSHDRELYIQELAKAEIAFQIGAALEASGLSQKGLAKKLGISEARVSQLLDAEGSNLTLKTLSRLAAALECELDIAIKRKVHFPKVLTEPAHQIQQLLPVVAFLEDERPQRWGAVAPLWIVKKKNVQWDQAAVNEELYAAA